MTFASFLPTNQIDSRLNLANGEARELILDQWAARLGGDQPMASAPTAVPYPDILSRNYRGYGLKWLLQSDNILYCIYLCCSQRRGDIEQICFCLSTYTLPRLKKNASLFGLWKFWIDQISAGNRISSLISVQVVY